MSQPIRVRTIIHGKVQGVFFRMETRQAAERLDVRGWVRNRPDGTVEAVIEGEEDKVMTMLEWCRQGPPMARVEKVDIERQSYAGEFTRFDLLR